jgi:hypothetical protein
MLVVWFMELAQLTARGDSDLSVMYLRVTSGPSSCLNTLETQTQHYPFPQN